MNLTLNDEPNKTYQLNFSAVPAIAYFYDREYICITFFPFSYCTFLNV